jgi:DNA polymerase
MGRTTSLFDHCSTPAIKNALAQRDNGIHVPNSPNMVTSAHDLAELIQWYDALGADCALDEDPQDRFEETKRQIAARQQAKAKAHAQVSPGSGFGHPAHSPSTFSAPGQQRHPSQMGQPVPSAGTSTFTSKSMGDQSPNSDRSAGQQNASGGAQAGAPALAGMGRQVDEARSRAQQAQSLDQLRQALSEFEGCSLKFSAKSLVFGDGNPNASLMCIGEAPGREEDIQGLPFVGRAGQLLDKMLAAIGRDRSSSYITNILPWRPPGNRKPSLDESEIMRPFIHRHIELVNPDVLIFLGGTAAQQLLGSKDGIMRLRGRWKSYTITNGSGQSRQIPAMATLHPAFLLRTPAQKRAAWHDLLEVSSKLGSS